VVSNLLELSRTVEPLTILVDSGQHSFPTSVIDVISDNTKVVFERASSEDMNDKLLSLQKGTVIGQPGGIKVRFILEQISVAEHKGEITLTVGNISSGGLRLNDVDNVLECEARQMLTACSIEIPDVEPFLIDLQVHNSYKKIKRKGNSIHYVGCGFKNLRANHEREIQNYINRLQLAQRAITK
jgi:c-di-GMP-binding flagellar brake protein YcgR